MRARSSGVVILNGSTALMRNGSMMVFMVQQWRVVSAGQTNRLPRRAVARQRELSQVGTAARHSWASRASASPYHAITGVAPNGDSSRVPELAECHGEI